jgi:hypothetical protein
MQEQTLDGHLARPVAVDLCFACQAFWFDARESLTLTPASTLTLFRVIGEHLARPQPGGADAGKCPRCRIRLRRTTDMQRATRFEYFRCPDGHGRLTTFFDFLKEKNFVRQLTASQIAELRHVVQILNCSNCGSPIDLAKTTGCGHCGSPLSMLDLQQAEATIAQLRQADQRQATIDPDLPLQLARARRDVEAAFKGIARDLSWDEVTSAGLVGAGLGALTRWLKRQT